MFTKFASLEQSEVLEVKGSNEQIKTASLDKLADYNDFRTDDGYLYTRIRAISSRVNKNHDGWPSIELAGGDDAWERISTNRTSAEGFTVEADAEQEYGFPTFLGKPVFVDHHNSNPKKARGVIVDSKFKVLDQKTASEDSYWGDSAPENHLPPVEVELLLEIDAKSFPKLAKAIVSGDLDGFSMGCDVEMSKCSVCENEARSPDDYCFHVKQKGAEFDHFSADGTKTSKKAYEDCYGIKFFEISAVFDPADETALAREVISKVASEATPRFDEGVIARDVTGALVKVVEQDPHTGAYLVQAKDGEARYVHPDDLEKTAEASPPQSEMTKAPAEVDTLREEKICPVCGSDITDVKCDVCGFIPPPDGLDNPDLSKARGGEESVPGEEPEGLAGPAAPEAPLPTSPLRARNSARTVRVTDEMAWDPEITPRLAAVLEADTQPSEEPADEIVTKDEPAPTTASKEAAEPADPSGKAKKQVDVTGVGGVDEDSNEAASKPDTKVNVTDKGGVADASNEQASKPDSTESVGDTNSDNAGFDTTKTTDDSGPTATFPLGDKDIDAGRVHDNEPFPKGGAKTGPAKPPKTPGLDVDADARVDLENSDGFKNDTVTGTDQWTGTGGNGVTRQQDPVTQQVGPGNDVKSSSVFRALKLADTEVKLGLTKEDDKYNRIAELAELSDAEFKAAATVVARVKTAGLAKRTARATSVPNLQRSPEPEVKKEASSEVPDEAVFFSPFN